jgi:hypothetical protein
MDFAFDEQTLSKILSRINTAVACVLYQLIAAVHGNLSDEGFDSGEHPNRSCPESRRHAGTRRQANFKPFPFLTLGSQEGFSDFSQPSFFT